MNPQPILIIAEAGVNHNGDLSVALRLIDAASKAGADVVKFQTFRADRLATAAAHKADYQTCGTDSRESQRDMLRRLELAPSDYARLATHCAERGVSFLSSAFDIESVDFLANLGQERFKIPSGEITNLPYLRRVASCGRPVLLSTGMATLGEVEASIEVLRLAGLPRSSLTLLHCTTEYPTPIQEVNLHAIRTLRDAFKVAVGYSDHTEGIEASIAAVALGASVIEKHFTLDRSLPGPDHRASLDPAAFAAMVRSIRNVELAMGDGVKRPTQSELNNRPIVRKSLVAAAPIRTGEVFTPDNVTAKRPGTGLSPMLWDDLMGKIAKRDYEIDEPIADWR